jgi:RNA polymerase sigma-70 factor (ECF subfamily)
MREEPPSFAALVERHRAEILAYLVRLLGNRDDAQDACQETLLRAHRAFPGLARGSRPRAWLYRIATRSAQNAVRRRGRTTGRVAPVDPDSLAAGAADAGERRAEFRTVARAVAGLPPRQRAALVLRMLQDLDYAEIAAVLGGNAVAARANVYQALKRLRALLGGN